MHSLSSPENNIEFWNYILGDINQTELDELLNLSSWEDPDFVAQRFLRARNNNIIEGWKMLKACLRWRLENGISLILQNGMHEIPLYLRNSMKNLYWRTDKDGDLVCYIKANLHDKNENPFEQSCLYTIWSMEIGRRLRISDEQKTTIVFDLEGSGFKNLDIPCITHFIKSLQAYYPEVLGKLLIKDAPITLKTMILLVKPIIAERTMKKIRFVNTKTLLKYINQKDLPIEYHKEGQISLQSINALKVENSDSNSLRKECCNGKCTINEFKDIILNQNDDHNHKIANLKNCLKEDDIRSNYYTTNPYQQLGVLSKDWKMNWNL